MSREGKIALAIVLIGIVGVLSLMTGGPCQYLPPQVRHYSDFRSGKAFVEQIETIRQQTGTYPQDDQVQPPSTNLTYRRVGSGFRILLEEGIDEWYVFDSQSRKWIENGDFGKR